MRKLLVMRRTDITDLLQTLATRIKERRRLLGITQEQLAERADMSVNFLAMIEIGQKTPSLETIASLAEALAVNVPYLLSKEVEDDDAQIAQYIAHLIQETPKADADFVLKICKLTAEHFKK